MYKSAVKVNATLESPVTDLCAPKLRNQLTQLCSPVVGAVLFMHLFLDKWFVFEPWLEALCCVLRQDT